MTVYEGMKTLSIDEMEEVLATFVASAIANLFGQGDSVDKYANALSPNVRAFLETDCDA